MTRASIVVIVAGLGLGGCTALNPSFGEDEVGGSDSRGSTTGPSSTSSGSGSGGGVTTTEPSTSAGTTGIDSLDVGNPTTGTTGEWSELVRCPGVAYGINGLGQLYAIRLETGLGNVVANVSAGLAIATDPGNGKVWSWDGNPAHEPRKIDPFADYAEGSYELPDPIGVFGADFDSDGVLWLLDSTNGVHSYVVGDATVVKEGSFGVSETGDLAWSGDRLVAVMGGATAYQVLPGEPYGHAIGNMPDQHNATGIVELDGSLWVTSFVGEQSYLWRGAFDAAATRLSVEQEPTLLAFPVTDLAPAYLDLLGCELLLAYAGEQ